MGARAAHRESLILASDASLRRWAKQLTWGQGDDSIPVTGAARDLGAFYNTTGQRMAGPTITRMRNGAVDAVAIGKLPRTIDATARMLGTKALSRGCYGVEATQPRVHDLRKMASCCSDALVGRHQTQRAPK